MNRTYLENSSFFQEKLNTNDKRREEIYLRALLKLHGKTLEQIRKEFGYKDPNSIGRTVRRERNNPKVIRYFEALAEKQDVNVEVAQPSR